MLLSFFYGEAEAKKRASGGTTVEVVVPRRNLPKGAVVDGNSMAAREVVADTIYEETILAADFGKVQGNKLVRPVEQGRPLRRSDLDVRAKEFAEALPEGKRAITIEIDEINSIAGMVRVGTVTLIGPRGSAVMASSALSACSSSFRMTTQCS